MKKVADIAAYSFILAVVVLSAVSILGVWDFFADDVIAKSFQSIGLLALIAIIVLIADHFIDRHAPAQTGMQPGVPMDAQPVVAGNLAGMFRGLRMFTLSILILSVVLLALLGILAIWEVLSGETLYKSLASIAIITFASLVIVVTCLERESNPILYKKQISGGMIALIVIFLIIFVPFLLRMFS